jgi:hypothetical protein
MNTHQFALDWLGKRDLSAAIAELFASPEWQALEAAQRKELEDVL